MHIAVDTNDAYGGGCFLYEVGLEMLTVLGGVFYNSISRSSLASASVSRHGRCLRSMISRRFSCIISENPHRASKVRTEENQTSKSSSLNFLRVWTQNICVIACTVGYYFHTDSPNMAPVQSIPSAMSKATTTQKIMKTCPAQISLPKVASNANLLRLSSLSLTVSTLSAQALFAAPFRPLLSAWSPTCSLATTVYLPYHLRKRLQTSPPTHLVTSIDSRMNLEILSISTGVWTLISKQGRWAPDGESLEAYTLELRKFLRNRDEDEVVVVSHGEFMHYVTGDLNEDGTQAKGWWQNAESRTYHFWPVGDDNALLQEVEASVKVRSASGPSEQMGSSRKHSTKA
jgi:hypothetical protein